MKVLIDAHALQGRSAERGVGRYSAELISRMCLDKTIEWHFLISDSDAIVPLKDILAFLNPLTFRDRIHIMPQIESVTEDEEMYLREAFIDTIGAEVLLISDLFESRHHFRNSVNRFFSIPTATILYDLIPLEEPNQHFHSPGARTLYDQSLDDLSRCESILCISQHTKNILGTFFPNALSKSHVINGGATLGPVDTQIVPRNGLLFIGGDHPRKNTKALIKAWGLIPARDRLKQRLIIVGDYSKPSIDHFKSEMESSRIGKTEVEFTGRITDHELSRLLSTALGVIHPAKNEGLGLPILDAIAHGVPVICSRTASMVEVGGTGAIFDPDSITEMADAIQKIISNEAFRNELRESQIQVLEEFNWDKSAELVISELYALSSLSNSRKGPKRKPRLAIIAPGINQKTGIARYAKATGEHLEDWYVVTHLDSESLESRENEYGWLKSFDRVLVHLGNSPHHKAAFDIAAGFPCVVFMHDIAVNDTLIALRSESAAYPEGEQDSLGSSNKSLNAKSLQRILGLAHGILVHSQRAKNYLLESGLTDSLITPLIHPYLGPERSRFGEGKSPTIQRILRISTCGFLTPNKGLEDIIDACAIFNSRNETQIELSLLGAADISYAVVLRKYLEDRKVIGSISGYLDLETLHGLMLQSDLAIQLRTIDTGESSGPMTDLIAFGIPTIVNDRGPFLELESSIVFKLSSHPSPGEIAQAIHELLPSERRQELTSSATSYSEENLGLDVWAGRVHDFLELAYQSSMLSKVIPHPLGSIADKESFAANSLRFQRTRNRFSNLVVASDTSNLRTTNYVSGIQRATMEIHKELSRTLLSHSGTLVGTLLSEDTSHLEFSAHSEILKDRPTTSSQLDPSRIPVILLIDLNFEAAGGALLKQAKRHNSIIGAVVYDLLPSTNPEWFPPLADERLFHPWLLAVLEHSDFIVTTSDSVKNEILRLPEFKKYAGEVRKIPLAAFPRKRALEVIRDPLQTLVVGTIEPRKGHADILDTFDKMSSKGILPTLHIVGRQGWMVESIVDRITNHPEFGRRLLWHPNLSDDELEELYSQVGCTIVASRGEGFGLPLVEAISRHCPVLARDIPVFRELNFLGVTYFDDKAAPLVDQWKFVIDKYSSAEPFIFDDSKLPTYANFSKELMTLIEHFTSKKT